MFTKIGTGSEEFAPDPEGNTYHVFAHTSDGNLHLISTKGVSQPKYSYFHRTVLTGGWIATFNIESKQWNTPVDFPAIDEDENREDAIFTLGPNLFLMVYSRYETVQFRNLYRWDAGKWTAVPLDTEKATKCATTRGEMVLTVDNVNNCVYTAVTDETSKRLFINKMEVKGTESAKIEQIAERDAPLQPSGKMVMIGAAKDKLYGIPGTEMCGFWWQPETLLVLDLNNKEWDRIEPKRTTDDKKPPFAYSGPRDAYVMTKDGQRWVMVAGSLACGMTQSEFCGEIWEMKLDNPEGPNYVKSSLSIPSAVHGEMLSSASDGIQKIYIHDPKTGVYAADI